ncbi:hypothetical protein LTR66_005119 [Elasticomyces elasticus]|nr:hypothetical protein LTR66_005119 [Elasticomyces elasticus]
METAAKLAGVGDIDNLAQHNKSSSAVIEDFPLPPPPVLQNTDLEAGNNQPSYPLHRRPSRASLPSHLSRPHSQRTQRSRQSQQPSSVSRSRSTVGTEVEEYVWGPTHPCFPHPNPHVPRGSKEEAATRVIRVKRDWMIAGDLAPAFQNLYPEILDPYVTEPEFRRVVEYLNTELVAAYDPWGARNMFDAVAGVLTGFLYEDAGLTGIKRRLDSVEKWIEDWNREQAEKEKAEDGGRAKLISLKRVGYLSLDIEIPDPELDAGGDRHEEGRTDGVQGQSIPLQGITA